MAVVIFPGENGSTWAPLSPPQICTVAANYGSPVSVLSEWHPAKVALGLDACGISCEFRFWNFVRSPSSSMLGPTPA